MRVVILEAAHRLVELGQLGRPLLAAQGLGKTVDLGLKGSAGARIQDVTAVTVLTAGLADRVAQNGIKVSHLSQ